MRAIENVVRRASRRWGRAGRRIEWQLHRPAESGSGGELFAMYQSYAATLAPAIGWFNTPWRISFWIKP